jgi:dihydropteroate synthase
MILLIGFLHAYQILYTLASKVPKSFMFTLNCNGHLLKIDKPVVMGIINCTPDSFYKGSRINDPGILLKQAERMIDEGAVILDIGGQSTRPGSERITADEECRRVIPAIADVHKHFPNQIISVDTYYAKVAREAINAGASIINDISGGTMDEELIPLVAAHQLPYVLMHMKGVPETMHEQPDYKDLVTEVFDFFNWRIAMLVKAGINDIIIDPGFGFGKTIAHNFQLLKHLNYFRNLNRPVMVGVSRKGSIYKTLQITSEEALNGSTVLHTYSLLNGAKIIRAHDVKEAKEAIILLNELGAFENVKSNW